MLEGLKKIGKGKIFLAIILGLFLFYVMKTTEPVLNYNATTGEIICPLDAKCYPAGFSQVQFFIAIAFIVMIVASEAQHKKMVMEKEAIAIAYAEAKYRKETLNQEWFQGTFAVQNTRRRVLVIKGANIPFRWVVGATVTKEYNDTTFFQIEMDIEGNITSVMKKNWDFGPVDICWKCGGKDGDIIQKLPEEIYLLRDIKSAVTQR